MTTTVPREGRTPARWWAAAWPDVRAALPGWIAARIVVLVALGGAHLLARVVDLGPRRLARLHEGLLAWDADWYLRIATHGYDGVPRSGLRFFPLLPVLARPLAVLFAGHVGLALLVLANVPALALGALLHRLALRETGDAALARRAAWLIALVPPAFVLVMGYTEPIALCMAVAAFLGLRTRRWGWAAAALLVAGLTRPVGVVLAVPAAIEGLRGWRQASPRERLLRLLPVGAPFAGTAVYLGWVWHRFGDPLEPMRVQSIPGLRGSFAFPLVTLWGAVSGVARGEFVRNATHIPWLVVLTVLVVITFRRWPLSYAAFAAVTLFLAASAEFWGSFERYGFGAFPVVLALASVTGSRWAGRGIIAVSALIMCGYALAALLNAYVP
jgi:hypothetical protein